jgi:hypothetical protein
MITLYREPSIDASYQVFIQLVYTVKPVYKGHSREPKNVPFIYRLKLYALYIYGENETALYRQWFVI